MISALAIPNNHHTTVNSYHNTHSIIEQDRDESIDSFKTDERSSKGRNRFFLNKSFKLNRKNSFRTFN
jgi:hypothetical protein